MTYHDPQPSFAPQSTVSVEENLREVHFAASGMWEEQMAEGLLKELYVASLPFIEKRIPFRVLGDLRNFQVQNRQVAEVMRKSQDGSAQIGVERMAIVYSSTLVKFQFRRVSDAINLGLFENKSEAIEWLRSND